MQKLELQQTQLIVPRGKSARMKIILLTQRLDAHKKTATTNLATFCQNVDQRAITAMVNQSEIFNHLVCILCDAFKCKVASVTIHSLQLYPAKSFKLPAVAQTKTN